jgi:hypothetical protein
MTRASHLVHEGLFGDEDDTEWKLALNVYDVVELTHSREQNELARAGEPWRIYPLDGLTVRPRMAKIPKFPMPRDGAGQR